MKCIQVSFTCLCFDVSRTAKIDSSLQPFIHVVGVQNTHSEMTASVVKSTSSAVLALHSLVLSRGVSYSTALLVVKPV